MENQLIIENLKNGKKQAIEQLVLSYRDTVYRTCLAYVQNRADAEDLTQEVFIKVIQKIDQFQGKSKLSSWIIRIAINLALNHLRDNKKRLNQLDVSDIQLSFDYKSSEDKRLVRQMVRKALYRLPEKQRRVFVLSYYLDLSYHDIMEVTGYSLSSVESLLFRARRKLRELLQDFYNDYNK